MKQIENFITKIKQFSEDYTTDETSYDYHQWLIKLSKKVNEALMTLNLVNAESSIKKDDHIIMVATINKGYCNHSELEKMNDYEIFQLANKEHKNCKLYTKEGYEEKINSFTPMEHYVWTYIIQVPQSLAENSENITI